MCHQKENISIKIYISDILKNMSYKIIRQAKVNPVLQNKSKILGSKIISTSLSLVNPVPIRPKRYFCSIGIKLNAENLCTEKSVDNSCKTGWDVNPESVVKPAEIFNFCSEQGDCVLKNQTEILSHALKRGSINCGAKIKFLVAYHGCTGKQ